MHLKLIHQYGLDLPGTVIEADGNIAHALMLRGAAVPYEPVTQAKSPSGVRGAAKPNKNIAR